MPDSISASTVPAGSSGGTAVGSGQAHEALAESVSIPTPDSQPRAQAEQPDQPESKPEAKRLWQDLDSAERDYKALHADYTRKAQALSQLGDLEDVRAQLETIRILRSDPGFLEWVQARLAREQAGSDDPQRQQAIALVEQIAERKAQEYVEPLMAAHIEQKARTVFAEMDKQHGAEWRGYRDAMFQILERGKASGQFSPAVETNFDLDFVNGLYAMATAADPEFAAKQYQKRLDAKREKTSASPGIAPGATAPAKADSFEEAYQQARRQLGLG